MQNFTEREWRPKEVETVFVLPYLYYSGRTAGATVDVRTLHIPVMSAGIVNGADVTWRELPLPQRLCVNATGNSG